MLANQLIPTFLSGIDDPCIRVCLRCMEAIKHDGESVEQEDLEEFEQPLMVKLAAYVQSGNSAAQRETETFIAVVAGQIEDGFAPYYSDLMPVSKQIILATLHNVGLPPTVNTLGVLLFLGLPWNLGKAEVLQAFGLVAVCRSCTFINTLSLSAVATHGKLVGGSSYCLISRSIGLRFYPTSWPNSMGAAMYLMGTVEAWEVAFPDAQLLEAGTVSYVRVTGYLIRAVAFVVVSLGVKFETHAVTGFLIIALLTILCMFLGCLIGPVEGVGTRGTFEVMCRYMMLLRQSMFPGRVRLEDTSPTASALAMMESSWLSQQTPGSTSGPP